jgi:hypothetical protein
MENKSKRLSRIKENNVTNKLVTIIRYKETTQEVQYIQSMQNIKTFNYEKMRRKQILWSENKYEL